MLLLCCYEVGVTLCQELLGSYSHAVTCLWVHGPSWCMVFNLSAWKHMNVSDIESCCCSEIPSRSHGIWTGVCLFVFVDLRTVFAALVVTVCWSLYSGHCMLVSGADRNGSLILISMALGLIQDCGKFKVTDMGVALRLMWQ